MIICFEFSTEIKIPLARWLFKNPQVSGHQKGVIVTQNVKIQNLAIQINKTLKLKKNLLLMNAIISQKLHMNIKKKKIPIRNF